MSLASDGWLDDIDVAIDWMKFNSLALQVDAHDIVHITNIDKDTGAALVRVFSSTAPHAAVIFEAEINLRERADPEHAG